MSLEALLDSIQDAEGGYWDDPIGGPTNFGITQDTLDRIHIGDLGGLSGSLPLRVEDLQKSDARTILKDLYIVNNNIHKLPWILGLFVGHGVVMAWDDIIKIMQRELSLKEDGIIGSLTLGAVESLSAFGSARLAYRIAVQFLESRSNGYKDSYQRRFQKLVFLI